MHPPKLCSDSTAEMATTGRAECRECDGGPPVMHPVEAHDEVGCCNGRSVPAFIQGGIADKGHLAVRNLRRSCHLPTAAHPNPVAVAVTADRLFLADSRAAATAALAAATEPLAATTEPLAAATGPLSAVSNAAHHTRADARAADTASDIRGTCQDLGGRPCCG